ncbi:histidine kinase [Paenibacillus sp. N4]|uniref:cache domain-containing sensor histidine kinase n=1 Tax=Paenibacillus vietnamensis TaxID=2590547 RepID=UPI001CD0463C|nr:sensor histidine kinase [Paenibacillus vietnamensis]MCA0757922.1 histidine kinase [Paenibacillus vietnamensis]
MKLKQQLEKWIIRMTRTMNLKGKFVLLYGLIVFIPTALLAVGAGYVALHSARANYMLTIEEAVRQSAQSISFKKQSYDLLATRTATDGELISRLSRDYTNMEETLETVQYVDRSFENTARYLPGIEDFRIYHANPTLVQDGGLLWKPELSGPEVQAWFDRTVASPDILSWSNAEDDKRKLVVTQKILSKYGDSYGVVYMLLDYNDVFAEPFNNPFGGAGELYIVDAGKRIIASSEPGEIGERLADSSLQRYWDNPNAAEKAVGGKLLLTAELNSGWTVAALVHLDQMEEQSRRIFLMVGIGITFFLLLSTFLIMTVLKNIVWRIRKLGTRMTDISQGDFEVTVKNRDRDELGELEVLFNDMSGRLGKLVGEITQANLKEREQSFMALQAQINPHFIYNSLSLVRWRAMDMQDMTQVRIIDAMTTFYRLALNNRDNITKIREEIEHLKAYVEIQQLRYPDRVTVDWQVEPDVMELYTIKLLLQPIVENCYLHGNIMRTPDAVIRVIVFQLDNNVHFEIHDNGKGIAPEALEHIREGRYNGTKNGFGMNNIRDRLKLYFGTDARFEIDSAENEWTVVSIQIPVCEDRPERIRGEEG